MLHRAAVSAVHEDCLVVGLQVCLRSVYMTPDASPCVGLVLAKLVLLRIKIYAVVRM